MFKPSYARNLFITGLLVCALCASTSARAAAYFIGISPYLAEAERKSAGEELIRFMLGGMRPGDSISVYDAYNLDPILDATIPNSVGYNNVNARVHLLDAPIKRIRSFLSSTKSLPPHGAGELSQDLTNAIREPQFLDFLSRTTLHRVEGARILLLGSPLYIDLQEPSFSMHDGLFPSDGHLIASRINSVYGVADKVGSLNGAIVYHSYLREDWDSDVHQERTQRFWTLFIQMQGGKLATFVKSPRVAFDLASTGSQASPLVATLDPNDTKPEMRIIKRIRANDVSWLLSENSSRAAPPSKTRGRLKIGIRWACLACDFDLYTRPAASAQTLSFRKVRTDEGIYYKDFQTSPAPLNGYEWVEYTSDVDINEVMAAVNFYSGNSPQATGEVRIQFDGKSYSGVWTIKNSSGNKGADFERRESNPFWAVIDLRQIMGLSR